MTTTIGVKIWGEHPSEELMQEAVSTINEYLPKQCKLSRPRVGGGTNYIYFDYEDTIETKESFHEGFILGLLSGWFLAKGYEVI